MTTSLLRAAQQLDRSGSAEAVWGLLREALAPVGIDHVIYVTAAPGNTDIVVRATLPVHADVPITDFDPFLRYCCDSYESTRTGAEFLHTHPYLDAASVAFIRAAERYGFRSGIGLPMRLRGSPRYGGFNLGTGFDAEAFEARVAPLENALRTFCMIAHRRLEELSEGEPSQTPNGEFRQLSLTTRDDPMGRLTAREREVLFLLSQGFSRAEIAAMCRISEHTVSGYTKAIYRKLDVTNKVEATRLALEQGLAAP